ncbi:hypothetical protein [Limnobacter parvus]|uniref:Uncharacterized protein n=1 Tax=Limnobacter parvus TaxID=2939690 RepID=A0ABT1XDA2_9BURK|nr:hypothetical protein [Limnobacter parvus]MCR2745257.1 hypothetical protein [Limnobacter parvus]
MSHKDFLLLKQWLADVGCMVFYLEHPFLGRPGDNQFEFLGATSQGNIGVFNFSNNLQIEIFNPGELNFLQSYIELQSIENLRVNWCGNIVELHDMSLCIDQ